jgi:hypothetical protein
VCPGSIDESLLLSIKLVLFRLGVLAAIYGHPVPFKMLKGIDQDYSSSEFANMDDARAALAVIIGGEYEGL